MNPSVPLRMQRDTKPPVQVQYPYARGSFSHRSCIVQIEHLSKLDFLLHEQLGKDAIFNSLPKSYLFFLSHYRMMKPVVNYHGLLGLLQTFEKDHQLQKEQVNLVGGSSIGRRSSRSGKKKNVQKSFAADPKQSKLSKVDKRQAECFFCKKLGH